MDLGPLNYARRPVRRLSQLAYLSSHLADHRRCAMLLRSSPTATSRLTSLKYLGDYLALSLKPEERRRALICHYQAMRLLSGSAQADLRDGILVWSMESPDHPPLQLRLETAGSNLEGELRLKFSFRSDLYRATFSLAPGDVCGSDLPTVLCIGELKGMYNSREEMREASRLNNEICPRTMLMLAIQALADAWAIPAIYMVKRSEQVVSSHEGFQFDYDRFSAELGCEAGERFDRLPVDAPERPLAEIAAGHRSRARRRREAKAMIRASVTDRFRQLLPS